MLISLFQNVRRCLTNWPGVIISNCWSGAYFARYSSRSFYSWIYRTASEEKVQGRRIEKRFENQYGKFTLCCQIPIILPKAGRIAGSAWQNSWRISRMINMWDSLSHFNTTNEWTGNNLKTTYFNRRYKEKLVPQNPNDEPASTLLERIRWKKFGWSKRRKSKKTISTVTPNVQKQ